MVKKSTLLTLYAMLSSIFMLSAQKIEHLSANNLIAGLGIGGNLFSKIEDTINPNNWNTDTLSYRQFRLPKETNIKVLSSASLCLAAKDDTGKVHATMQRYVGAQHDKMWYNGVKSNGNDSTYKKYYSRVFKVTQNQIDSFINYGTMPNSIRFWPARGNPLVVQYFGIQITENMAPFVDLNTDGIYSPLSGDYPAICGEEGIFMVFNDTTAHYVGNDTVPRVGVEVRCYAEVFLGEQLPMQKDVINNTVFVHYDVVNKSTNNYSDTYCGLWADPDLGCFNNDLIGCDSSKSLAFIYNSTLNDPNCLGSQGFGPYKSGLGVLVLNPKLYSLGSTGALTSSNLHDQLQGKNVPGNNSHTVILPTGDTVYSRYIFPSELTDTLGWNELNYGITLIPGERRILCGIQIGELLPNQTKSIDLAFFVSYDSTATHISIVDTLKRDAAIIQQYYDNVILPCRAQNITGLKDNTPELKVSVSPNPTKESISIKCNELMQAIAIHHINGQEILTISPNEKEVLIKAPHLSKGLYLLFIRGSNGRAVKKILIE